MNGPRIVTPQEARLHEQEPERASDETVRELAHTVATETDRINVAIAQGYEAGYEAGLEDGDADASKGEPGRTRAAVVKALGNFLADIEGDAEGDQEWDEDPVTCIRDSLRSRLRAIENGANW